MNFGEASVTITIQNVNDNNPEFEFTSYTFEVTEEEEEPRLVPVSPSILTGTAVEVCMHVPVINIIQDHALKSHCLSPAHVKGAREDGH